MFSTALEMLNKFDNTKVKSMWSVWIEEFLYFSKLDGYIEKFFASDKQLNILIDILSKKFNIPEEYTQE